ncbi:MAG: dienelactone hydrolase family protein [Idiomarina sp.]|nr:dienelactone hydrolase family protein [Idiomarina sp.]
MFVRSLLITALALLLVATNTQPAEATIETAYHEYEYNDVTFRGYVAHNSALEQSLGTVMIVHDWDGPNAYEEFRAQQLAGMGYRAFVVDLFGRDRQPTSMQENRQRTGELYTDRELFRGRLQAALAEAKGFDQAAGIVAMGYCFGGAAVLEMARAGMQVDGFVSFHGGLDLPAGQDYQQTQAPVLVLHGSADPVSDMQDLAALMDDLQSAGVAHDAHIYGGALHSFSVHSSSDYDLAADQASWRALTEFLRNQLD